MFPQHLRGVVAAEGGVETPESGRREGAGKGGLCFLPLVRRGGGDGKVGIFKRAK